MSASRRPDDPLEWAGMALMGRTSPFYGEGGKVCNRREGVIDLGAAMVGSPRMAEPQIGAHGSRPGDLQQLRFCTENLEAAIPTTSENAPTTAIVTLSRMILSCSSDAIDRLTVCCRSDKLNP